MMKGQEIRLDPSTCNYIHNFLMNKEAKWDWKDKTGAQIQKGSKRSSLERPGMAYMVQLGGYTIISSSRNFDVELFSLKTQLKWACSKLLELYSTSWSSFTETLKCLIKQQEGGESSASISGLVNHNTAYDINFYIQSGHLNISMV